MINIDIPGLGKLEIENVAFDYNGTLAVDGKMSDCTKQMLLKIKELVNVSILTADTYGTVREECETLDINVKTFPKENAGTFKEKIVKELGGTSTLCIGNGFNDIKMFKESCLAVAILGEEGCSAKLLLEADIVVKSIEDAFNLLLNTNRIKAALRN